jgi:hypothetical protein
VTEVYCHGKEEKMEKIGRGVFLIVALCVVLMVAPAASGGGGQHYPNGAEDCVCGMAPPPGWHIVNYLNYYDAEMDMPAGKADVNVWAEVLRVIYSSDKKIFGGTWLCHLFVPYLDVDIDPIGSASGVGDLIFDPFIIAWHGKTYHGLAGLDIYAPTGNYDEDDLLNAGKNFWTFEPVVAITGMYETGWSWSLKLMYDFNTENDEYLYLADPQTMTTAKGRLQPGDEIHFDYSLDYGISKNCRLGACGYYYKQVSDDEIDDVKVPGGKGEAFAVGPVFMYSPMENLHLVAKAQFEVDTENRSEGNSYWFKIIYSF